MSNSAVSQRVSEFIGVACFAVALIWMIALVTHDPADPAWFFTTDAGTPPANFVGRVGAFLSELSFQLIGYAAGLTPVAIGLAGWHYFWCRSLDAAYTKAAGVGLFFVSVAALLSLLFGRTGIAEPTFRAGGSVGDSVGGFLADYFNRTGSIIILLALVACSVILSTQVSFGRLFATGTDEIHRISSTTSARVTAWLEARRKAQQRRDVLRKHARDQRMATPSVSGEVSRPALDDAPVATLELEPIAAAAPPVARRPVVAPRRRPVKTPQLPLPVAEPVKSLAERRTGEYTLPPPALLDPARAEHKVDERELMALARQLEDKCREFSVAGQIAQIHPGPVVTTFEFKPEAGIKYNRITSLSDDLCLAMEADSVIIDRIPGKSTVGIQIPNPNREAISLRELLESDAYERSTSKLTLALGKTIHGEPYFADLATMPHLLIAGSTGTGKSVGLNAMLTSILYRATPDDVRLIMIDPKRLELGMYEDIPHLMTPVVVDPKKAANALRWAVREMEERYKNLAAAGVRNIEQYNRNVRMGADEFDGAEEERPKPLPFIVVVIDELADLMMVASNEVEESICRLAQMARAVGIHLILATQRPSVDVITGLIKANLPSRISFRVSSKTDSRTILDSNGAEQLLGRGDMLYLPPASSRCIRLHGPYISEQESARLASFLRKQGSPTFDQSITADPEKSGPGGLEFEKDDLYDDAARIVIESGQVSISYLQRKLRVGFSRAARLVDMMEAEGLVSATVAGKSREVLVDRSYFEEIDAQLR